jgi:hypothetical protein
MRSRTKVKAGQTGKSQDPYALHSIGLTSLIDHREDAVKNDSNWRAEFVNKSPDERANTYGCGYTDCQLAVQLPESFA